MKDRKIPPECIHCEYFRLEAYSKCSLPENKACMSKASEYRKKLELENTEYDYGHNV